MAQEETPQSNTINNPSSEASDSGTGPVMGFFDHADELRLRLMRCLYIFMAGFVLFYFCSEPILAFLRQPLFDALPPERQRLYFTSLFENFLTHLKVAGYASLCVFSPLYFHQLWGFIAPGLRPQEKRWVIPFLAAGAVFFILGAGFAYKVLFPVGFKYFVQYGSPTDVPLLTIAAYYDTCMKLMFLFGVSFELPVILVFLGWLGVVNPAQLRTNRRTAILIITVMAALFAPPDAVSMLLLMAPLILMYECSIFVIAWIQKTRPPREQFDQGPGPDHPNDDPWRGRSVGS
ncbi:MAG: twin-arginine translocase subunit TatC [Bdellovibrionales bacterium]|nr:twin-arginine translocase subunit TatC [Bdellovibrionales bacterium]